MHSPSMTPRFYEIKSSPSYWLCLMDIGRLLVEMQFRKKMIAPSLHMCNPSSKSKDLTDTLHFGELVSTVDSPKREA